MRAAYYETNGAAREVLRVGDVETPQPGRGEVRVRLAVSGVNPSDVKSRAGLTRKIAFPRVIPHSDGAGEIEQVGEGVSPSRVGERVWVWNGQWRRPFGTAAASIVLPSEQAVPLPANIGMEAAACLGIPAYTAYQAVLLTGIPKVTFTGNTPADELRINLAVPVTAHPNRMGVLAGDNGGFPNGRRLTDDVIDIEEQAVAGFLKGKKIPLGDGVNRNDEANLTHFPYVGVPHGGYANEKATH